MENQESQPNPEAPKSATVTEVGTLTAIEQVQLEVLLAKRGPMPPPVHPENRVTGNPYRMDSSPANDVLPNVTGNDPIHASRVNPANTMDRQDQHDHTLEDELARLHESGNVHIAALLRQFVAIRDKWYPLG